MLATAWYRPQPSLQTAWLGPDQRVQALLSSGTPPEAIPSVIGPRGRPGPTYVLTAEAIAEVGGDQLARTGVAQALVAASAAQDKADAALPASAFTAEAIDDAGGDPTARAAAAAASGAAANAQDTADDAVGAAATAQGTANTALASATTARTFLPGALSAGVWRPVTGLPRLLLNGTGTVTIDARNRAGTVTTAVYSNTLASAVNQIDFPFFGEDAVEIRAAYTGSASAEIV